MRIVIHKDGKITDYEWDWDKHSAFTFTPFPTLNEDPTTGHLVLEDISKKPTGKLEAGDDWPRVIFNSMSTKGYVPPVFPIRGCMLESEGQRDRLTKPCE
ncbi:MAG: hypothetical protein LBP28_02065 [Coriobacteriales bacterium]|jgi:hypothetical protein|nr:hypothetical protein [Coriobacteriales bacterium]